MISHKYYNRASKILQHLNETKVNTLDRKNDFPGSINYTYLSAANVALTYNKSTSEIINFQNSLLNHGAVEFNDSKEENAFEHLRNVSAKLLNCNTDDIAGGSSYTELAQSIAWAIAPKKHQNIVGTAVSFPSTVYPWKRVADYTGAEVRLAQYDENYYTKPENILKLIDENTAVITLSHVEFTNGQCYDLEYFARVAHSVNALLVIDATQSAGAIPIDVYKSKVDVLIAGGYKWLCSSFGAAVMYIAPHLYLGDKALNPGLYGFRSHKNMWDCDARRVELKKNASRYEFATLHFGAIAGLAKSIEYLYNIGIDNIYIYNLKLANYLIDELNTYYSTHHIQILRPSLDLYQSSIVTFKFKYISTDYLIEELLKYKVVVTNRNNFIRVSPHIYNTSGDINYFLKILNLIINIKSNH